MVPLRTEGSIIERARAGDRAAMEEVLASVAPSIRRFALRMCRSEADADDVLQDALVSIATRLDTFEGRSSLPSWAFTLARFACMRRRRGKKNQSPDGDDALAARVAEGADPEEGAAMRETSRIVGRALEELPDDYREVLLLRDAEGLTAPEAAVVLGVSVDALKSRLHRARAALRDVLRPTFEADASVPLPTCPDVVRALSQKLEDELTVDACASMEKHVEACAACARTCDALKDALRACRASPRGDVSPEIRAQVRAAVSRWLEKNA
jgi:RNA polymerase sigma-70 factor (ECF subfamily)